MNKKHTGNDIFFKIVFPIITMVLGIFISDITYSWRENIKKGDVEFNIIENNKQITAIFRDEFKVEQIINDIKNRRNYKIKPGKYEYSLYIGPYMFYFNNTIIKQRKKTIITVNEIPNSIFYFDTTTDKEVYGPGDEILLTLYSTIDSWVYLFHYNSEKYKQLNQEAIFLRAYNPKMINEITANKYPGEDNIVGIALADNNKETLDLAIGKFKAKKSEYSINSLKWKSDWITFIVK